MTRQVETNFVTSPSEMQKVVLPTRLQQRLQNLENLSSRSNDGEAHFQKIKKRAKRGARLLVRKCVKLKQQAKSELLSKLRSANT